jgi:tubulin monoglycylase TTLL3/8
MYKHGYLRTSSDDYNLSNGNNYVHLTNNCLQKFGTNYGVHEDGNTVGFHVFQAYLDENFPNYGLSVERDFIPRMKDLIIDTYNATKLQLNPNRRKNVFELLGYDFLIDEDFRLWLIEVNTNPCLEISCPLLARIIPEVLDNVFRITLDPIFPSPDLGHNRKCAINEIP